MKIKRNYLLLGILLFLSPKCITAQAVKGLYVDIFGSYILGNAMLETDLINYAQSNGINYLILYDVESFVISRDNNQTGGLTGKQQDLSDFISSAKSAITDLQIGVTGGVYKTSPSTDRSVFFDNVVYYNLIVNDLDKAIDVINLEYEYWNIAQPVNFEQNIFAFGKFIDQLDKMRILANATTFPRLLVETYIGRFDRTQDPNDCTNQLNVSSQAQADAIDPLVDRVLMHIYMPAHFMQSRIDLLGFNNLQFEFDHGYGKRMQAFNNNSFPTTFLPLWSSESSDFVGNANSHVNFYGDYLWFSGLRASGVSCSTLTLNRLGYDLKFMGDITVPLTDFNATFQNNVDPYGPNPNFGNPCIPSSCNDCHFNFIQNANSLTIDFVSEDILPGNTVQWDFGDGSLPSTNFIESHTYSTSGLYAVTMTEFDPTQAVVCSTTLSITSGTGGGSTMSTCITNNIVGGEAWFKYSSMPLKGNIKPLYIDLGPDKIGYPGTATYIHPTDFTAAISAAAQFSIPILRYDWFKNGEFIQSTFPLNPELEVFYSTINLHQDVFTCDLVLDHNPPKVNRYRYRDDITLTADVSVSSNLSYYSIITTPATCPNFNNGTASIFLYQISPGVYSWDGQATTTQTTVSNLSPGMHTVAGTGLNGIVQFEIKSVDNSPIPFISQTNPYLSCDKQLFVNNIYSNYTWYLGANIVQNGVNNIYDATLNGSYTVEVTDENGCIGSSTAFGMDMIPNSTITGSVNMCQPIYSVPLNSNSSFYNWTVPNGATFVKSGNTMTIDWGTAVSGGMITCTVSNACGISSTGSIQVTPLLISVISTYKCPGLNNGSAGVLVTSGGLSSNCTYSWTGSSATTPLITSLAAGNYSVTVTNTVTGCTASATVAVSNFPTGLTAPTINGTSSASPGSHVYTLSNYNSTYDNYYSWNAIANSGSATISYPNNNKQSATIQWPASGGRIVISFGVQGCLQTTTYYVQPYCQSTFTYLDGANQSAVTSANVITRSNMTFNGVLNITSDFTFLNCGVVSFAPGAKILVQSGYSLTIDNCTFTASNSCCKMWKGIELQPGAKIIVRNNTYISQAEYAIIANNGSIYKIKDSHFRNNYISLQVGTGVSTTNTNSNLFNTDFYSDPHTCGGTMYYNFLPKYDGQTLNPGSRPLAGIKADNVTFMKFGASTPLAGGDVRFNNLTNGVISNNSNVYIQNSTFKNMPSGAGVIATGGLLSLHGMGGDYVNSENTFENCHWGVNARSCELAVHSSKSSDDLSTAVYYSDCGTVNITDNAFSARYYGIHGYHNPNSTVAIEKNKIHMSGTPIGSACIRLDEFGLDPVVRVAHNDLYLSSSRYGIVIYSVHNAMISENYIQMNNAYNISGIRSYYSSGNTFQCNTVNAMQRNTSGQSGISMSLSPENTVSCNWMNNQHEGIRISGACSPMDLQGNIFNDHNFGLSLTYNGLMGVQENKGNLWSGTYTSYGAYLSGLNSNSAMANQVLFYDPSSTGTPPTTNNDILNYGWFQGNGNSEEFSCVAYDCQPFVPVGDDPRVEDEIIAEEDDIGTEYVEPSNYFADRFLFERLMADPSLMQDNPILQAFYDQKIYGTIGRFTEMRQSIEDAVKWETVYETVYSLNESMIKTAADSLSIIDSLLENGYTGPTNAESLNETIKDLMASNDVIRETIAQMKEFRIANSLDDNSEIPVSDLYDENESTVNQIYLETVASGHYELSGDQILQLFSIAEQCPFSGGPSVYKARSLYNLSDPTADWDDDAICIFNGIQPRKRNAENLYNLFPNPSTGVVTLNYKMALEEKGVLNIYNMLGVLLSSTMLNPYDRQLEVDLSNFNPALYHYKIMINNHQSGQGMISLIR